MRTALAAPAAFLAGTAAFAAVAVLLLAPITLSSIPGTLIWAACLSAVTFLPAASILGLDGAAWRKVLLEYRHEKETERALAWVTHGALIGTWVGAWPIPLDWDAPWQVWPRSCLYGLVLGVLASLVGFLATRGRSVAQRT